MTPDLTTLELSRIHREADTYGRWFRYYDELLVAGIPEPEAIAIVEAAQADERQERRIAA